VPPLRRPFRFFVRGSCIGALTVVRLAGAAEPPVMPAPVEKSDPSVDQARPPAHREVEAPRPGSEVLLLHTVIAGTSESEQGPRRLSHDAVLRAQKLDLVLTDAIQDFGLTLDLSERGLQDDREISDLDLVARAAKSGKWVVYPSVDTRGNDLVIRLAGVAPGSKTVVVRTESVKPAELAVRAVVMLRDVIAMRPPANTADLAPKRRDHVEATTSFAVPARSQGRAILAFNAALFGGFVGYSVQRSTGSDDPRLLYPLMALGTGVGIGASAIVSEEWDVGIGDAWFLSAAAWWPGLSGLFIARGREHSNPSTDYSFAMVGALSGLALATTSLATVGGMSEGGALLTHSGGAFGTVLGGLTELAIRGTTDGTAYRGLGYGAGAGAVLAGTVATFLDIEPSRVLTIDLGAGLGGLAGAAATSPFIFRERTPGGDRTFLITTMAATVGGGLAAWFWTRKSPAGQGRAMLLPYMGVVAESRGPKGAEPVIGLGVTGSL
jgi:hypothetical protein